MGLTENKCTLILTYKRVSLNVCNHWMFKVVMWKTLKFWRFYKDVIHSTQKTSKIISLFKILHLLLREWRSKSKKSGSILPTLKLSSTMMMMNITKIKRTNIRNSKNYKIVWTNFALNNCQRAIKRKRSIQCCRRLIELEKLRSLARACDFPNAMPSNSPIDRS